MVRGCAALRGRSPPASGGRGDETTPQTGETEKERQELLPETAGSLRRPSLLPKSALSPPPLNPARAARPGRRARKAGSLGPGRVWGPRAPHVVRALPVPLLFSWAPRNPQLPRFHRPQLEPPPPPPPRFSAMQLQGSLFPRLRSPALPDSEGRRRAGGGGRRGRRGRPGQVSVPAAASLRGSPAAPPPGARGGGGKTPGWGAEAQRCQKARVGRRSCGPERRRLGPRRSVALQDWGVSHLLGKTGKNFAPAAWARETRAGLSWGAVMRSPSAAE